MFPVSDVIPSRTTPYITIGLVVVNALAFLYELQLDDEQLYLLARQLGVVPAEFRWVTAVTSMFLHDGWIHIGGNLLYLWIFGDNVEDALGHAGFAAFYLACGVLSALGQVAAHPASADPMIGASGAIAGVMGAYFVLYPRSRILTAIFLVVFLDIIEVPALFFLGVWFVMQLFSGVGSIGADAASGEYAFWAHVVGFVAGIGMGAFLRWRGHGRWQAQEVRQRPHYH
jgi:membrane associated rhomboid family serine protease